MYRPGFIDEIYRPGIIDEIDHVVSGDKDLLYLVSWRGKKLVNFPLFYFLLISTEMIPNFWNMHGSNEMTSLK